MDDLKSIKKFPIVAIGASAGGLEAVIEIMKHLSPETGMAFIYVQHLDPDRKSMLQPILGNVTKMNVQEANHHMPIVPNNVYIIPHNKDLSITDGLLVLHPRTRTSGLHMPIDQLFISLAESRSEYAIGVLLSGTAHDGTMGFKRIKLEGGITIAQDESSRFPGMPKSAIEDGTVDLVLSPRDIALELERLGRQTHIIRKVLKEDTGDTTNKEIHLQTILQLLHKNTGVDFTNYKMTTIRRRIVRRMLLHNLKSLNDYARYLRAHSEEVSNLFRDLLINVTSFFRDPPACEYLQKTLFPKIIKSKGPYEPVRIWIPACSTGEEAYSMAMIMMEVLGDNIINTPVQLFATDLSEAAIAKARRGVYSRNDLLNVPGHLIQHYFTKIEGEFRVIKQIRDLCVFAPQNVFRDPPFSKMDFISCCNLLIYLEPVLQRKILSTFHYALNNNGYLMLGKSETIGNSTQLFSQVEKKYRIYQIWKEVPNKVMFDLNYSIPAVLPIESPKPPKISATTMQHPPTDMEKTVNEILLKKYVPASVVVNAELEILHFKGSTSLFLEPSPGKASFNLLKMARPGIEFELRSAIHKAGRSGQPIKKTGLEIKIKDSIHHVSIEVSPLTYNHEDRLFLIVFEEMAVSPTPSKALLSKDKLVLQLQDELKGLREDMRSILSEQESSHEELQSANEEILSNNEELQSTVEELETSKEEIESTNEELMTINTELQTRNEQLTEASEHSDAILGKIREAVLVLDKNQVVKAANNSFYSIFQTHIAATEGKSIFQLLNGDLHIPELKKMLEQNSASTIEVERRFKGVGQKTILFNAKKLYLKSIKQEVILLIIDDITGYKAAEKIIADRETWFRNMADNAPVMIWVTDRIKKTIFFNKTWLSYTGREPEQRDPWLDIHQDDRKEFTRLYNNSLRKKIPFTAECRLRRHDSEWRWILVNAKPTSSPEGNLIGLIGTCTEIHDQRLINMELEGRVKQRTAELDAINKDLERSNFDLQQFAFAASHDLQEPLRKIISFSDKLLKNRDQLPESSTTYIDKISSASIRMTKLIDDLLNFSRISSTSENFVATDLKKTVKTVLSDFEEAIHEKKVKLHVGELPVIEAVPFQMEQLFHNLVGNAIKFSAPGRSPRVTISSRELLPKNYPPAFRNQTKKLYEITVADNGIGFSKKYAEQIFEIFQRLNDRDKYPGTGIGLALCRKIVEHHGGKIVAESAKDKGSKFKMLLPVSGASNVKKPRSEN